MEVSSLGRADARADSGAATRTWLAARALLALALATPLCTAGCGSDEPAPARSASPPERPLSVLLVTLDTTRADALSSYAADGAYSGEFSAPAGATPTLDDLAARGVRYTSASTVAPLTLPAHASMLTGQIPPVHGLRENGLWGLPADARTLAEDARSAGARTAAFIGAVVLDRSYGLDQGFELYDQPQRAPEETSSHYVDRSAEQVVDAALGWFQGLERDEQAFVWVHFFDPHQPYAPPAPYAGAGATTNELYQGEVNSMDAQLGRLLASLDANGRLEDTLVLVAADHGESLGEHGEWSHAAYCYEATLRVPFLVAYPNGYRAGEVSSEIVSVVDVAATAREALGLASGAAAAAYEDGLSLYGRAVPAERRAYFESFSGNLSFGWAPIVGQRSGTWKVQQSSAPQVFDLAADPGEARDLAATEQTRLDDARAWLASTLSDARRRALSTNDASSAQAAADMAALGYTAAGAGAGDLPDPLSPGDLPAPHERIQEYRDTLRASALQNEGLHEEAQRLAHSVVRRNAGNVVALQTWTAALLSLQRHAEAAPGLQRLVALRPGTAGFHYNLGVALSQSGQADEGIAALWRAVELDFEREAYLSELQRLLRELGRREEFEAYGRRWQELKAAREARASR